MKQMGDKIELYATHGQKLARTLGQIGNRLRDNLLVNDRARIISSPTGSEVVEFESQGNFPNIIDTALNRFSSSELSKSPGHDRAHIVDVVKSVWRQFIEYDKIKSSLSELEKLEVVLACLGHDFGRYFEPKLGEGIPKRSLEVLMPFVLGKDFFHEFRIPNEIGKKILLDIATGFEVKTGYRQADIVHQADREQGGGSIMVARLAALGNGMERDFVFPEIDVMMGF